MKRGSSEDLHQRPARNAEELARLASSSDDPGARIWFLEWAKAFAKLALIHDPQGHEGCLQQGWRQEGHGLEG